MKNAFLTLALASAMIVGGLTWTNSAEARPRYWRGGWGAPAVYSGGYYSGGYYSAYPRYYSRYYVPSYDYGPGYYYGPRYAYPYRYSYGYGPGVFFGGPGVYFRF